MHQEMDVLRFKPTPQASRRVFPVLRGGLRTGCHILRPGILACGLYFAVLSAPGASPPATASVPISLLREFRPIGGSGNNLEKPDLNVVPGSPELALAPLNFAPGTRDGLVNAPNARTISNVIAGGTGANGQNGQTDDPLVSAWIYVFGQFVDHDIDLEETPPTSASINIIVPTRRSGF